MTCHDRLRQRTQLESALLSWASVQFWKKQPKAMSESESDIHMFGSLNERAGL